MSFRLILAACLRYEIETVHGKFNALCKNYALLAVFAEYLVPSHATYEL